MKRIHWIRAFAYSFLAELGIVLVTFPLGLLLSMKAGVYSVPFASFAVMLLAGVLLGRRVERRVLHGALIGIFGAALYIIIPLIIIPIFGPAPATPPELQALASVMAWLYPVSHGLKILGGALGGLVAERRTVGAVYDRASFVDSMKNARS
jgi:hypothetical protein